MKIGNLNYLKQGLIAYYGFENGKAADESGNNHNGTIHGNPEVVKGVVGDALKFHGDEYIVVPNEPDLNPKKDVTVSAWFITEDTASDRDSSGVILTKGQWNATSPYLRQIEFGVHYAANPYNSLYIGISPDGDTWRHLFKDWNISNAIGVPHLLTGVYKNGKTLELWLDGKKIGEKTFSSYKEVNDPAKPENLYIAGGKDAYGKIVGTFQGVLDEIRIYDRSLSKEEIETYFDSTVPIEIPTLVPESDKLIISDENTYNFPVSVKNDGLIITGWKDAETNQLWLDLKAEKEIKNYQLKIGKQIYTVDLSPGESKRIFFEDVDKGDIKVELTTNSNTFKESYTLNPGEFSEIHPQGPWCGLVDSKGKLIGGRWDDLSAFSNPRRKDATLLWFTKGDITYSFPKPKQLDSLEEFKFIAEISSEKGGSAENWPSPISFYIGNLKLGDWTIPGDPGDRYGKVAKHPLPIGASQYGWLVTIDVRKDGTYLKTLFNGKESEKKISNVTIEDVKKVIGSQKNVNFKIVVKGNPTSGTGINIYGKGWGDYDVNPTVEYIESSKSQKEDRIGELEKRAIIGYSTKTVKFGDKTSATFQVPVLDVTQKVNLKFGKYERLMPNGEKITVTVPESVEEVGVTPTAQPTTETINIENPGKPVKPNKSDYINAETGKFDKEAYAEAMAKYKEDLAAYKTAFKTYKAAVKAVKLEAKGQYKSLKIEQKAVKTVNKALAKLVKGERKADKYVTKAEVTLQRVEDYRSKAEELRSEANERATALLGEGWTMDDLKAKLEKPNKSDFIDPETGKLDREAYNKAMAEYKEAKTIDKLFNKADKYDLKAEKLENKAEVYQEKALELSSKTVESFKAALEGFISKYTSKSDSLRKEGEGLLGQAEGLEGVDYYKAIGKGQYEVELAEGYERGAEIATAVLETYVNVDVTSNPDVADSLESVDISNININI